MCSWILNKKPAWTGAIDKNVQLFIVVRETSSVLRSRRLMLSSKVSSLTKTRQHQTTVANKILKSPSEPIYPPPLSCESNSVNKRGVSEHKPNTDLPQWALTYSSDGSPVILAFSITLQLWIFRLPQLTTELTQQMYWQHRGKKKHKRKVRDVLYSIFMHLLSLQR